MDLKQRADAGFEAHIAAVDRARRVMLEPIASAGDGLVKGLLSGGKILSCGNGGAAAIAQLFAAKMLHRFSRERPGPPATTLTADSITLTAIANTGRFEDVFAKQVNAIGHPGDILLAISASGNAANVVRAAEAARERQMSVIALTGGDGGMLAKALSIGDVEIRAPADSTPHIEVLHLLAVHGLCELIDAQLLGD